MESRQFLYLSDLSTKTTAEHSGNATQHKTLRIYQLGKVLCGQNA